jgi:hypothetical protein
VAASRRRGKGEHDGFGYKENVIKLQGLLLTLAKFAAISGDWLSL